MTGITTISYIRTLPWVTSGWHECIWVYTDNVIIVIAEITVATSVVIVVIVTITKLRTLVSGTVLWTSVTVLTKITPLASRTESIALGIIDRVGASSETGIGAILTSTARRLTAIELRASRVAATVGGVTVRNNEPTIAV